MDTEHLPMTQLEVMLKYYLLQNPDMEQKILFSSEYSQYLSWMAKDHEIRQSKHYTLDTVPILISDPLHRRLAERAMKDAGDTQAFFQLAASYETQNEDQHILADYDISVGRMLRYMPAQWHSADHFMIYYAQSGSTTVRFQNDTVILKPGAVLIVAPHVVHANLCFKDDSVVWYFLLRASTFDRVFWSPLSQNTLMSSFFRQSLSGEVSTAYLYFDTFSDREIAWLVHKITTEFAEANAYRAQMLNTMMHGFFILLLRKYEGTARLPCRKDFYWKHEFSGIFSYIQANYASTSLTEVADQFHYSQRQVSRIIQKYTGMSYAQLLLKLKMEKAGSLLQEGVLSMAQISAMVGYSDVSSFYRAFTKYFQKTPSEYTRRN